MKNSIQTLILSSFFALNLMGSAPASISAIQGLEGPQPRHKSFASLLNQNADDPEEIFLRNLQRLEKQIEPEAPSKHLFYSPFIRLHSSLATIKENIKILPFIMGSIQALPKLSDHEHYTDNVIMQNWQLFIDEYEKAELSNELKIVLVDIKKLFEQFKKEWSKLYDKRKAELEAQLAAQPMVSNPRNMLW